MGMYSGRCVDRYEITKEMYDYLLPIYGYSAKMESTLIKTPADEFIVSRDDIYFFVGRENAYKEVINRCEYLND